MKTILRLLLALAMTNQTSQAQTGAALSGQVWDNTAEDVVPLATVQLKRNGEVTRGTAADFDGLYNFSNIPAGTYDIEVASVGLPTLRIIGLEIRDGQNKKYDLHFPTSDEILELGEISPYSTQMVVYEGSISGIVFNEEKNYPVAYADVCLEVERPKPEPNILTCTQTNLNGEYHIEGITKIGDRAGTLIIRHPNYPDTRVYQVISKHYANNIANIFYPKGTQYTTNELTLRLNN